jgi:hypothetical protein
MTQLMVKSGRIASVTPLIQAALQTELRVIATGIRRTQTRLRQFEQRYGFSTEQLLKDVVAGVVDDNFIEIIEWLGESRLLTRLQTEYRELAEIEICA